MQEAVELEQGVALIAAAPCRPGVLTDDDLLADLDRWEALGRLVDARRAALAGEVAWRSRDQIGEASLARRNGDRDATDLLARELRISGREARRRTRLGLRIRSGLSLAGEDLPGRWPHVAAALESGAIGTESARLIIEMLAAVARRSDPTELEVAEAALTESARSMGPDLLRVQAEVWQAALDPDGAKPAEDEAHRNRGFRLGREGADGVARSSFLTETEITALLRAALHSRRRGVQWKREPTDDCEDDTEWHEAADDRRTKAQFDHDTLVDIIRAGIRALTNGSEPAVGHAEVVVHVDADDLEQGRGCAWADDVAGRISIPTVVRLQCAGVTRLVVTGKDGEALYLGHRNRLFSTAQRRALAARDGGCAWPGCTAPVAWTEGHHIMWVGRDGGRTDIDNGVLLCSFHHHRIHSSDECEIRIHAKAPHLVPKGWRGDPLPRHRMQRHRIRAADPPGRAA